MVRKGLREQVARFKAQEAIKEAKVKAARFVFMVMGVPSRGNYSDL